MRKKSPPPRLAGKRTTLSFYFTLFFFAALLILASSCQKDEVLDQTAFNPVEEKEGMIKLGKKLENPYTVDNMRKAYANLVSRGILKSGITIDATHLYIRFLPATNQEMEDFETSLLNYYMGEGELELLEDEFSADFYDYPLDYEIYEGGTYYYDPELPPGGITWQYTVVPVNYGIPPVHYQIIDPLYLNGAEYEVALSAGGNSDPDFWDLLETEALKLAGDPDAEISVKPGLKSTSWRPSGRITVWDDIFGRQIPLHGAKVRARRWFTIHTGITNLEGSFTVDGTFKRPANYSIIWERNNFSIRSGTIGQALYNGPKKEGNWNLDIRGGKSQFYATIFRASYHYYYGAIYGLKRPPENSFWKPQMKIAAMYETNNDYNAIHAAWKRVLGILNWIKIYNPSNSTREIYGTTIHELAHASHWDMDHSDFNDTETKVKESWARGVQWSLTSMIYSGYQPSYFGDYTGIVEDMIDGIGGYDQVSGYTIKQIEDAVKHQKSWNSWRDNIINKYHNETEINLQALFAHW